MKQQFCIILTWVSPMLTTGYWRCFKIQFMCTAYLLLCKQKNRACFNQIRFEIDKFWPKVLHADWLIGCNFLFRAWADCTASQHWFFYQEFDFINLKIEFHMLQWMFEFKFESNAKCIVTQQNRMIHVWCIIFPYTMYHTKIVASSLCLDVKNVEVLVWQCNIKTVQTQLIS